MNSTTKHYLFCPGPVNTAANVKEAASINEIGHREEEFVSLFERLQQKVLAVFEVKNKSSYFPVFITGSGSAANEAVLSSIVGNKTILIISNGEFGERLYAISKLHNKKTKHLPFAWGEEIDTVKVEKYLRSHRVDIIAMVHHETCTGMLNPVEKIGALTKKYGITFFIDTVSSAGAEKIDLEKWNVSFCSTSASKALASLPGLAIVIGKKQAFDEINNFPQKTSYLHLPKFYEFALQHNHTPNTPAVQLFFALEQALDNILAITPAGYRARIKTRAQLLRQGFKKLDLIPLIEENYMSCSLTSIFIPQHITVADLKNQLRTKGIIIYDGKGIFKGRIFQVANIGEISDKDIHFFLQELTEIIHVEELKPKKSFTESRYFLRHLIPSLAQSTQFNNKNTVSLKTNLNNPSPSFK